jgi:hypothetical protein
MRHWKDAKTVADLGQLMADWLEGRIPSRPGYYGSRPDPETSPILPTLVAACRAGFITDNSQPGCDERGADGARWQQRAAVTGWVADPHLFNRLLGAARDSGLIVVGGRAVTVTTRDGKPYTAFGETISRRHVKTMWDGVGRSAMADVLAARQVTIVDRAWGESDRLWWMLQRVFGGH